MKWEPLIWVSVYVHQFQVLRTMTEKVYINLTPEERETLYKALDAEFSENRITAGGYVRYLAENRMKEIGEVEG